MIAVGSRFTRTYYVLGVVEMTDEIEIEHIGHSAWMNSRMVSVRPVSTGYGGGREMLTIADAAERVQSGRWNPVNA